MPNHIDIIGDVRITNGQVSGDSFSVFRGGTVQAEVDLNVSVEGDVYIAGVVRGAENVDISIRTRSGNIYIVGEVIAGQGRDGVKQGENGENAGDIRLAAANGEIIVSGQVQTRRGGNGAKATNHPSPSRTLSGGGGDGGDITLAAEFVSTRGGRIRAGKGGDGGEAEADGWDVFAMFDWINENWRTESGLTEPVPDPPELPMFVPVAEILEANVLAISGNGGNGGKVSLSARSLGFVTGASELESGRGGNALAAKALRSRSAKAVVGQPGAGGAVAFGGEHAVWTGQGSELLGSGASLTGISLVPGDGGASGDGLAAAAGNAVSEVSPGGGGGKSSTGTKGNGGASGKATAMTESPACTKEDGPRNGDQDGPGAAARAACP